MIDLMLADAKERPDLFRSLDVAIGQVGGPTRGDADLDRHIAEWIRLHGINVPNDLVRFWNQYSRGLEVFETEILLGPFGESSQGDDVIGVNEMLWSRGMPRDYVVFHCGLGGFSAVRQRDLRYVQLDGERFREQGEYSTLDEWYRTVLRSEFAERYGLARI